MVKFNTFKIYLTTNYKQLFFSTSRIKITHFKNFQQQNNLYNCLNFNEHFKI